MNKLHNKYLKKQLFKNKYSYPKLIYYCQFNQDNKGGMVFDMYNKLYEIIDQDQYNLYFKRIKN